MTGWRVGWLVAQRDLARKAAQLNEFIISHAPSFTQRAAETALVWGEGELRKIRTPDPRDFSPRPFCRPNGGWCPDTPFRTR